MRVRGEHVRGGLVFKNHLDVQAMLDTLNIRGNKRGTEIWVCCPFHGEHEASCQIKDARGQEKHGLWRCFGCGKNGNAAHFVAGVLDLDYNGACDWIERWALDRSVRVPMTIEVQVRSPRKLFELPAGVESKPLERWPEQFRNYANKRGITPEMVRLFGIGYSVIGYLQNRIVFPNIDRRNRIIGYSARSIDEHARERYLTPRKDDGADASGIFGEHLWGDATVAIVTEGAINGLAMWHVLPRVEELHGAVVAACCGSHIEPSQLDKLRRFEKVIVATDPDAAGDKAMRTLEQLGSSRIMGRVRWAPATDAAKVSEDERIIKLCEVIDESTSAKLSYEPSSPVAIRSREPRWCVASR